MDGPPRDFPVPAIDLTASGVAWTQMGETIEASSTSSGYDHGSVYTAEAVYMDAGTLYGDGNASPCSNLGDCPKKGTSTSGNRRRGRSSETR